MPGENSLDPRARLTREKYFSLRPKPLEQWLWTQGVSASAERVFWLHWEEGMKSGDWCSEVPVRRVATLCRVDVSSVTRAYQVLKTLGLIRRADPGRDPANPFQQATAVTEVRLPPALMAELARHPNRRSPAAPLEPKPSVTPAETSPHEAADSTPARNLPRPTRQSQQALWSRASQAEKGRYFAASRDGQTRITFDAGTQLTVEDQAQLFAQLEQMARPAPAPVRAPILSVTAVISTPTRALSPLELARARKQISAIVPCQELAETFRQVIWAVEEGALRKFERPLALNIALKKLREGAWTRPHKMPSNWMGHLARLEMCSAA
jgi:hypothetical protein